MYDDGRNLAAAEDEARDAWAAVRKLQYLCLAMGCVIGVLIGLLLR